jgi:hypothetical protein
MYLTLYVGLASTYSNYGALHETKATCYPNPFVELLALLMIG